jgi:hypothetical protein
MLEVRFVNRRGGRLLLKKFILPFNLSIKLMVLSLLFVAGLLLFPVFKKATIENCYQCHFKDSSFINMISVYGEEPLVSEINSKYFCLSLSQNYRKCEPTNCIKVLCNR